MTTTDLPVPFDPTRDLLLERAVDVPPHLVWRAWTRPEDLKPWFCPRPWRTTECEIDLRPGGVFRTVMEAPNGERFDNSGCYLEIVENRRLVWTGALGGGYRPLESEMPFTGYILIEPAGEGTRYRALVLHRSPPEREKHEAMGFHQGWGAALDQLVEYANGL